MITIKECKYPFKPLFTEEIPNEILDESIEYFDRDGYELTKVERKIHEYFNIKIGNCLNHHSVCYNWVQIKDEYPILLDHSFISVRYGYDELASASIKEKSKRDPRFLKLLSLRPKFGIDISIDYAYEDKITELLHIEKDFTNLIKAIETKRYIEDIITKLKFKEMAQKLIENKKDWENLQSDDQSDYKAQYFGFNRAFDNIKAYV